MCFDKLPSNNFDKSKNPWCYAYASPVDKSLQPISKSLSLNQLMDLITDAFTELHDFEDVALFAMRFMLGFIFIVEAYGKSKDVKKFSKADSVPLPIAYLLTVAEFTAGLFLILGVLTQLSALVIMFLMLGSMSYHIFLWKSPYWAREGGWEYDLMIFVMALVILMVGGGDLALWPLPGMTLQI